MRQTTNKRLPSNYARCVRFSRDGYLIRLRRTLGGGVKSPTGIKQILCGEKVREFWLQVGVGFVRIRAGYAACADGSYAVLAPVSRAGRAARSARFWARCRVGQAVLSVPELGAAFRAI